MWAVFLTMSERLPARCSPVTLPTSAWNITSLGLSRDMVVPLYDLFPVSVSFFNTYSSTSCPYKSDHSAGVINILSTESLANKNKSFAGTEVKVTSHITSVVYVEQPMRVDLMDTCSVGQVQG